LTGAPVAILRSDELGEGELKKVVLPGHEPLVAARWQGKVFVLEETCTHGMAPLSEGAIENGILICPFHGGGFDLATGAAVEPPCRLPLKIYAADEVGGVISLHAE